MCKAESTWARSRQCMIRRLLDSGYVEETDEAQDHRRWRRMCLRDWNVPVNLHCYHKKRTGNGKHRNTETLKHWNTETLKHRNTHTPTPNGVMNRWRDEEERRSADLCHGVLGSSTTKLRSYLFKFSRIWLRPTRSRIQWRKFCALLHKPGNDRNETVSRQTKNLISAGKWVQMHWMSEFRWCTNWFPPENDCKCIWWVSFDDSQLKKQQKMSEVS